jgi:nucleoside-diphosphate-sugar epimerase
MKIAITGGRGKIGRAVVALALSQGHSVVSMDRVPLDPDTTQHNEFSVVVDMTQYAEVENAFRGCDAVVHLAAIPTPTLAPDYEVHNNNVVGSYNALSAAVRMGIKRVCQASSINAIGAAYSRMPHFDYFPLDEQHPTYNEDAYSLSKWICEQQGDSFARRYEDMTIASMRFHWVVPDRAHAVKRSGNSGDVHSKQLWAYTTYDAAARACLLSLTAGYNGHEAFFIVAPDTAISVPSLELKAKYFPDVPVRGDLGGNSSFFNSAKAERMLGWKHNRS